MSLTKDISDKKVNFEFNKEFISVFNKKIKDNDTEFLNKTLKELHPADSADIIENLTFEDRSKLIELEGFNIDPMLNFLDNMNDNPSDQAIVELFDFMQNKHLPITDDGHFLAYKAVSPDFKDIYTGGIDNSVGSEVSIDRSKVDSNRSKHCSAGLHVGAIDYVKSYGGIDLDEDNDGGNQIVICKVNPADVVSVPSDSRFQKLRCCKYEVVSLFNDIFQTSVHMTDAGLRKVARTDTWKHEIAYKLENVSQVLKRAKVCVA